jgi:mitogen-activated protein kinase 1/3
MPNPCSHDQLKLILDVLGTPPMEEFYDVTSRRSRDYLRNLPVRTKKSFESLYPQASPAAIDFLKKTLTCKYSLVGSSLALGSDMYPFSTFPVSSKKRMTMEECLAHPYLEAYHDPEDEPGAAPLDPNFFEFDLQKDNITREELKKLL